MPSAKQRWLILFSALVVIGFHLGLICAMQRYQARKPDFAALYQTGRKVDHQHFPAVFRRFPLLDSPDYKLWLTDKEEYPSDVNHPPCEAIIFAALAFFKFRTAYLLWWTCNLGFLFWSAALLWSRIPRLQSTYPYLLVLIATFFPVLVAFVQGQDSIMLLAFLTLCYRCLEEGSDFRAGFILGLGMFKFVPVTPMAFWLVLEKRWKSLAGFLTGCAVLFFIALWAVGMGGIVDYVRLLAGYGKKAPEDPGTEAIMPNLRGLFHYIGSGVVPEIWIAAVTIVASVALLIWVAIRLRRYSSSGLFFAVQVLLTVMISYHLYPHDAAILVLPMLLLLNHALDETTERTFKIAVLLCAILAYLVPFVAGLYVGMPVVGVATLCLLIFARNGALKTPALSAAPVRP